jgi:hypothetical protein
MRVTVQLQMAPRRSPIREFVQEPMNTRSIEISSIGVPGSSAMYSSARSAASRSSVSHSFNAAFWEGGEGWEINY